MLCPVQDHSGTEAKNWDFSFDFLKSQLAALFTALPPKISCNVNWKALDKDKLFPQFWPLHPRFLQIELQSTDSRFSFCLLKRFQRTKALSYWNGCHGMIQRMFPQMPVPVSVMALPSYKLLRIAIFAFHNMLLEEFISSQDSTADIHQDNFSSGGPPPYTMESPITNKIKDLDVSNMANIKIVLWLHKD